MSTLFKKIKLIKKSSADEQTIISDENDEPAIEESMEYPSSPQARYPLRYVQKHNPTKQGVGELNLGVQTRRSLLDSLTQAHDALLSMEEPKDVSQASQDQH